MTQNLECRADSTILQDLTTVGVLTGENAFAVYSGPVTLPNAQLVALPGTETKFKLRAFYSLTSLGSLNFDETTVRKT